MTADEEFPVKGVALEDIRCGASIELDPRSGRTRITRTPEHKCPTKFACGDCGKEFDLFEPGYFKSLEYKSRMNLQMCIEAERKWKGYMDEAQELRAQLRKVREALGDKS